MSLLHLFFAGLIGFVPSPDGKSVHVLLVDDDHMTQESSMCGHSLHDTLLVVRESSLIGGECPTHEESIYKEGFCVWELDNKRIMLHGFDQRHHFSMRSGVRDQGFMGMNEQEIPENSRQALDISWLADLGEITPDGGTLKPEIYLGTSNDRVAARLKLDKGTLKVCHLVEAAAGGTSYVHVFEFREATFGSSTSSYRQALADVVQLEARLEAGAFTIYLAEFGSDKIVSAINLDASESAGPLEVAILNVTHLGDQASPGCIGVASDFGHFVPWVGRLEGDQRVFLPYMASEARLASVVQPCQGLIMKEFLDGEEGYFVQKGKSECRKQGEQEEACYKKLEKTKSLYTRPMCPMAALEN